jgi:hypothetical protein
VPSYDLLRDMYLDLLKKSLTGMIAESPPLDTPWMPSGRPYDASLRALGVDWPSVGETMIGLTRLENIQECVEAVVRDGVPGDLLEAGVWRGGACIFMKALLEVTGQHFTRKVWVADSFQGLHRHAEGHGALAVPMEEVQRNFRKYGLLDDQVRFIPGWFHESLPGPVGKLAVLRLDGDQYVAQRAVLDHLYPLLSPGGYVIIDDYPGIEETRQAVDEYRAQQGIMTPVQQAMAAGWWQKE